MRKLLNRAAKHGSDIYKYEILFRSGRGMANAFALPAGQIIMTDELVELAENDDQIYAGLLHEMGHVEMKHGIRRLLNDAGVAALIALALPNSVIERIARFLR